MSEHHRPHETLHDNTEQLPQQEQTVERQRQQEPIEAHTGRAEQQEIDALQETAEKISESTQERHNKIYENTEHRPKESHYVNKELRKLAYNRTMLRVRKQLNPADRTLSRVIHAPVIEKTSELAAKSIARPSGLLGGGIAATIGTTAYYWLASHYGYEYNFTIFLLLVASGFGLGLLLEALRATKRSK